MSKAQECLKNMVHMIHASASDQTEFSEPVLIQQKLEINSKQVDPSAQATESSYNYDWTQGYNSWSICEFSNANATFSHMDNANTSPKVNGCAGNMRRTLAKTVLSAGPQLVPLSLTSPCLQNQKIHIGDAKVHVCSPSEKDDQVNYIS
ncbi:hypothetical protein SUGI_0257560 [Cryptomeria japonica]|nr:hypothetical protein SUGI_0257560 [Cryptomeria japonica]